MIESSSFNVAQLLKEPIGATRTGQVAVDAYRLMPESESGGRGEGQPEAMLAGAVRLMNMSDGILVQGELHAEVSLPCSRCLEPVTVPLDVAVEEIFVPTIDIVTGQAVKPEDDDSALWIDEHHILDLREVLRQDLLLTIPVHPLCRKDCKGLCSTCGQNLNEVTCQCQPEPDPRWATLAVLLKNSE